MIGRIATPISCRASARARTTAPSAAAARTPSHTLRPKAMSISSASLSPAHRLLSRSAPATSISRRHNSTSASTEDTKRSTPSQTCPSCSETVPFPQTPCPGCSALLPLPSGLSHHSILHLSTPISSANTNDRLSFDLAEELRQLPSNGFEINKSKLRQNWLLRQRDLHPDKFSARGEKVVNLARDLSGRVNEAYNVLRDELKRAEYLLSLHSRATDETDKLDDPMMLAEILEAREELEEATSQEEVDKIREVNHEKVVSTISALSSAFSSTPPNFDEAKDLAVQLKYWRGLEDAAKEKVV